MRCNLTVLFVIATALVILVFAWVAAVQGNNDETTTTTTTQPGESCATCPQSSWWE